MVRTKVCHHAKRSVLWQFLPDTRTLVFQKDLAHAGTAFSWGQCGVSDSHVQRGVHLLQYQYGIHRGSGGGLSDRAFYGLCGSVFPFFCDPAGNERMDILFPFLFLLFLFVDSKVESTSAHQTEYYAVYFCADAAVCAFGITFIPPGKRKVASEIYLNERQNASGKSYSRRRFVYESTLILVWNCLELRLDQSVGLSFSLINNVDFLSLCI